MNITIHRGTRQIGGCVTEVEAGGAKIFIDFGADLPGIREVAPLPQIEGLTMPSPAQSALFLTHYHDDHTGRLGEIMPDVPVYMGGTAKAVYLNYARRVHHDNLPVIENIRTFSPLDEIRIGGIAVTPLMVDHSAFDAYMFVIEAEGKRILHTGDFRLHGFRGSRTLPMLMKYATNIDCIVCENTTLSRDDEVAVLSERELQGKVRAVMKANKYVFALCASTNIDRIASFYHANPSERLFVCDEYQQSQLEIVRERHAARSELYKFDKIYNYAPNLDPLMEKRGFCMLIRQNRQSAEILARYKGRSRIIYSMWTGYLKGDVKNEKLVEFLHEYKLDFLHTSGHAKPQDLAELYKAVNPTTGLIPIHGEEPEKFRELIPGGKIHVLKDGEKFSL